MSLQTIDDVNIYMNDGYSRYGSQNKFLASDEYRNNYSTIAQIINSHNAVQHNKQIKLAEQAMQEVNAHYGDTVKYGIVGMFMNIDIVTGIITKRNDLPVVKLNEKFNGKRFINWNKGWQKVNK